MDSSMFNSFSYISDIIIIKKHYAKKILSLMSYSWNILSDKPKYLQL